MNNYGKFEYLFVMAIIKWNNFDLKNVKFIKWNNFDLKKVEIIKCNIYDLKKVNFMKKALKWMMKKEWEY